MSGILAGALVLALAPPVHAGAQEDYEKGANAYRSGDIVGAMGYLRKASAEGHAPAQALLGYILDISEEDEASVKYFRMAAEQGNVDGQYGLGAMYLAGEGLKRDPLEATKWFKKAAEQGHHQALVSLAQTYWNASIGIEKGMKAEPAEALAWLERAAAVNDPTAMSNLAQANRQGLLGLPADEAKAQAWEAKIRALSGKAPKGKERK